MPTKAKELLALALQGAQTASATPLRAPQSIIPQQAAAPVAAQTGTQQPGQSIGNPMSIIGNAVTALKTPAPTQAPVRIGTKLTQFESGGKYDAKSKSSSASGVAQWLDSTWGNYDGYKRAADAPPEVQNKRLANDMDRLTKKYGGDEKLIALAWIGGEGAADKLAKGDASVLTKKDANGLSYGDYINRVIGQTSSTPAKTSAPASKAPVDSKLAAAKQGYEIASQYGKVDGLGVSSAQHKIINPNSDHDKGLAFDLHLTGPEAVEKAKLIPGVTYLINQNTQWTKNADGTWSSKYYGGKFKNGQPKDDHASHIHVDFG